MHKKALILWADGKSANLGVRVLAEGAASIAAAAWPGVDVTLQDFAPNSSGFSPMSRSSMIAELAGRRISRWLSQYDVILDTGAGDSFSDIYGLKRLVQIAFTRQAAARQNIPYIYLPQTFGPFESAAARRIARASLRRADAVFTRDSISARIVQELTGAAPALVSDLVFALPVEQPIERRDVLLNVSGLLWSNSGLVASTNYREQVELLVNRLRSAGREVTLLAHVLENSTEDRDPPALEALSKRHSELEVIVPKSLAEVRRIIAGANIVIGSRMHACLNALSQGVPTIPWAYSRKFAPLMSDLGWNHVVDLRTARTPAIETLAILEDPSIVQQARQAAEIGREKVEVARELLVAI